MSDLVQKLGSWHTSTFSTGACTCVQALFDGRSVHVRDSKTIDKSGQTTVPIITVSTDTWSAFLRTLTAEDSPAERPRPRTAIGTTVSDEGGISLQAGQTSLQFSPAEWRAFARGVEAGEFDV